MKRIGLTQRVEMIERYGERRDCLDQKWTELLLAVGYLPIPLPNCVDSVSEYVETLQIGGVILTGGNDLCVVPEARSCAPERDRFEHSLLDYCSLNQIPVLGICRGLQLLVAHYGGELANIGGHVARRHRVHFEVGAPACFRDSTSVNSFHSFGVWRAPTSLVPFCRAEDGSIEGLVHSSLPQYGIMWHPEREQIFEAQDLQFIRAVFEGAIS